MGAGKLPVNRRPPGTGRHRGRDHIDRELQAILEGTARDARFREPTADDRGKLAKQAQKRREADAKKLANLHSETQKQTQKLQKKP